MAFDISLPARGTVPEVRFSPTAPSGAARIVPVAKGEDGLELPVTAFAAPGLFDALVALGATGSASETVRLLVDDTLYIATGLGAADAVDDDAVRRAYGSAARTLAGLKGETGQTGQTGQTGSVEAAVSCEFGVGPVVEGLILGGYAYAGQKSRAGRDEAGGSDGAARGVTVTVVGSEDQRAAFERAVVIAESTNLARDLVNTPANHLYPESYARVMREVAQQASLDVEVLDEAQLEAEGFGGILAVGRGSARPPRLVHLSWDGAAESGTSVALVGKGITFDTGGISLKPAAKMEEMISDMGGSAAQLAAIVAAARLALPVRVDAWLPLAENMPSGTATRPGDVITHYGGLTSEIINTDAEGRLVLADAIARACEGTGGAQPSHLIETATLTGAQLVALGTRTAGVMGSDDFRDAVAEAGREVGERAWAMPLLDEHVEELASPVADIRNTHNARTGGMLFAGLYLSRFVPEGTQWVHIDVAGPAWNGGSAHGYTPARATGAPVRTIVETLTRLAGETSGA
ncbi:leucyl aminopeptidase [Corynebacterium bouchesdurhonense]|uniref:leucyl aminopeptidase n=1 Tax=Corynebacterium bouchesdurhonense TaxID=1720192 RepID=UPI00082E6A65|nr:leucyl aminopeptidase [Corynebacterium bouchesdurhonense]